MACKVSHRHHTERDGIPVRGAAPFFCAHGAVVPGAFPLGTFLWLRLPFCVPIPAARSPCVLGTGSSFPRRRRIG